MNYRGAGTGSPAAEEICTKQKPLLTDNFIIIAGSLIDNPKYREK